AGISQMTLLLPRLLQTLDRDGRVSVLAPDGLEVHGQVHEWDRFRVGEWSRPLLPTPGTTPVSAGTATSRTPAQVDVTWAPMQLKWPVDSVIDVTLDERQAHVRQQLRFPPTTVARSMVLRPMPGMSPVAFRVVEGAKLVFSGAEMALAVPPGTGREQVVSISYAVPLRWHEMPTTGRV